MVGPDGGVESRIAVRGGPAVAQEGAVDDEAALRGEGAGGLGDEGAGGLGRDQVQQVDQQYEGEPVVGGRPAGLGGVEAQRWPYGPVGRVGGPRGDGGEAVLGDIRGLPGEARKVGREMGDVLARAAGDFERGAGGWRVGPEQVEDGVGVALGGRGVQAGACPLVGDGDAGGRVCHGDSWDGIGIGIKGRCLRVIWAVAPPAPGNTKKIKYPARYYLNSIPNAAHYARTLFPYGKLTGVRNGLRGFDHGE